MDYSQTNKLAESLTNIANALANGLDSLTQATFSVAQALNRLADVKERK